MGKEKINKYNNFAYIDGANLNKAIKDLERKSPQPALARSGSFS